jgi:hypothetical protein
MVQNEQDSNLQELLSKLSSDAEWDRDEAQKKLLILAKKSERSRKEVTRILLENIDRQDIKNQLGDRHFSWLWVGGAAVLSKLKSPEAISFFIKCIDCSAMTEYASDTYHHLPAIRALIRMGDIAVPQLSNALHDNETQIRHYAALCLGNIGGMKARKALTHALQTETDVMVRKEIENSIATINRTPR